VYSNWRGLFLFLSAALLAATALLSALSGLRLLLAWLLLTGLLLAGLLIVLVAALLLAALILILLVHKCFLV
jgi:hypothetical protein